MDTSQVKAKYWRVQYDDHDVYQRALVHCRLLTSDAIVNSMDQSLDVQHPPVRSLLMSRNGTLTDVFVVCYAFIPQNVIEHRFPGSVVVDPLASFNDGLAMIPACGIGEHQQFVVQDFHSQCVLNNTNLRWRPNSWP